VPDGFIAASPFGALLAASIEYDTFFNETLDCSFNHESDLGLFYGHFSSCNIKTPHLALALRIACPIQPSVRFDVHRGRRFASRPTTGVFRVSATSTYIACR
jgi:hypothetical protein